MRVFDHSGSGLVRARKGAEWTLEDFLRYDYDEISNRRENFLRKFMNNFLHYHKRRVSPCRKKS